MKLLDFIIDENKRYLVYLIDNDKVIAQYDCIDDTLLLLGATKRNIFINEQVFLLASLEQFKTQYWGEEKEK